MVRYLPTPCLVLAERMLSDLPSALYGTDLAYAAPGGVCTGGVFSGTLYAILLRACYALSGTDLAYAPTSPTRRVGVGNRAYAAPKIVRGVRY
eukprot:3487375-Rhodomonas_salina.1